jgi:hypothetical protein
MSNPVNPTNGAVPRAAQRASPVRVGNCYLLLDKDNEKLGEILVTERKKSWFFGRFSELPAFKILKALFEEHRELVNQQAFSLVEEVEEKIASLGLYLSTANAESVQPILNVQIGSASVNFQVSGDDQGA